jgi:hypothetical protein
MNFAGCAACVVRSRMAQSVWLIMKDRNHIIEMDAEDKVLLNRIIN